MQPAQHSSYCWAVFSRYRHRPRVLLADEHIPIPVEDGLATTQQVSRVVVECGRYSAKPHTVIP